MSINTERLTLRRVESADWEAIMRIWENQKACAYARFDKPNDTSPAAVKARIAKWASFINSTEHMFFAVCLQGCVIGYIALNKRISGYEIGYCFHSQYHGNGYAKESLSAVIKAVWSIQPDAVITAGTALENLPSVRLLNALGFCMTGTEQVSFYNDEDGNAIYFEGGLFELSANTMN